MTRFLMLLLLCPAVLGAQTRYASESLKLRAGASMRARVLTTISAGSAIDVRDCDRGEGEWCLVAFEKHRGFVEARLLDANVVGSPQPLSGNALTPPRLSSPSSTSPRGATGTSGTAREGLSSSSSSARRYFRGPRGGCYTYAASGRKRYVDHSYCN